MFEMVSNLLRVVVNYNKDLLPTSNNMVELK